jgi:hypothetical protein
MRIKAKIGRSAAGKPALRIQTTKAATGSAAAKKAAASRASAAKVSRTTKALDEIRRETRSLSERADRLLERLG